MSCDIPILARSSPAVERGLGRLVETFHATRYLRFGAATSAVTLVDSVRISLA